MRIAYFTNQYPKVSHSFIRREILALEKQGFAISRFALRGWDEVLVDQDDLSEQRNTKYVLQDGFFRLLYYSVRTFISRPIRFLRIFCRALKLGLHGDKSVLLYLIYFLESCVLLGWLRESNCKHVHVHFGTNSAVVAMFAHLLGDISYSFTVHGPEEFDMPKFLHIREKAKYAEFLVAISSYGRSQLYRHIDYKDWSKVNVVHCGLEASFYEGIDSSLEDTKRLVCVGRICEQKGQLLLIEAMSQLRDEGLRFDLVLAGDGEMREEVETLISEFKLTDSVHITGWVSAARVRDEILNSRALILPSFAEGLPVVIMEAFALRRPVLSTYVAGIPELLVNGEHGWLFPAGSVESIKKAIRECLEMSVEELSAMGDAAYERVLVRHAIDHEAGKLARLISAVI